LRLEVKVDCTPSEYRRLIGGPDILPICDGVSVEYNLWLILALTDIADPAGRATIDAPFDDSGATEDSRSVDAD
jgi:hypothetical protein